MNRVAPQSSPVRFGRHDTGVDLNPTRRELNREARARQYAPCPRAFSSAYLPRALCAEAPRKIVTDQLRSYPAAKAEIPELAYVKHVFASKPARGSDIFRRIKHLGLQFGIDLTHDLRIGPLID